MPEPKYPLPSYLLGIISLTKYLRWLNKKAWSLLKTDRRRKRLSIQLSPHSYKEKIHEAIMANGITDPFTGDKLRWDLIKTWDDSKDKGHQNFVKEFWLMPTVDHIDPYGENIEFEICSWLINECKSDQTPGEFIKMCNDITAYRAAYHPPQYKAPAFYFLPSFLNGICTLAVYKKWLNKHANVLYMRDRDQKRPYALTASVSIYKKAIHAAANAAGLFDPYTGKTMKWEMIGTWNDNPKSIADKKAFYLLPTVDHIDPFANVLEFEICSWRINSCKTSLTPDEFIAVCRKVTERAKPA